MNWFRRLHDSDEDLFLHGENLAEDPFGPLESRDQENRLNQVAPYLLAGMTLIVSFGFVSQYLGQNAAARGATSSAWEEIGEVPRSVVAKTSLLRTDVKDFDKEGFPLVGDQAASESRKGDFNITLASLPSASDRIDRAETLIFSPPIDQLEKRFEAAQIEKQRLLLQKKRSAAEENCLAVAIYFEARSESELGQRAIAKVIMNRVKDPAYPKTVCGVVYQNITRGGSCQFSFTCDGKPDEPKPGASWTEAKAIARSAMGGELGIDQIRGATHYHADYVNPKWAGVLKRIGKIGRHIFYSDS